MSDSYFNLSHLKKVQFIASSLPGTSFLNATVKKSTCIDTDLTNTLLCNACYTFEGTTTHKMTKPVIAYSTDFERELEWGDLCDPLLMSLRKAGALALAYSYDPKSINDWKLTLEVNKALPNLEPHDKKSIPMQLLEQARPGSELAKIREQTTEIMQWCDGVCVPGGRDVDPKLYAQSKDYSFDFYKEDLMEMGSVIQAHKQRKPILGICRGAQLVNVALGGTIKDVKGEFGYHSYEIIPETNTREYTLFQNIYGNIDAIGGYSAHSQALDQLAPELQTLVKHGDVPKLVTNENGTILLSQFHPEIYRRFQNLDKQDFDWNSIFQKILEKFQDYPKVLQYLKNLFSQLFSLDDVLETDVEAWKHFFDYFISRT